MATLLKASLISAAVALALPAAASAAPEIRTVSGATPPRGATINAFKADAGDRRSEINWDGVPASATFPTASRAGSSATSAARSSTRPASAPRSPTARRGAAASSATRARSSRARRLQLHERALQRARHAAPGVHERVRRRAVATSTRTGGACGHVPRTRAARRSSTASPPRPDGLARRRALPGRRAVAESGADPRPASRSRRRPPSTTAVSEPQADLAPPPEPSSSRSRPRLDQPAAGAAAARLADHAGQVRTPQPHAQGRGRQLGRHRGHAHARQGRPHAHARGGRDAVLLQGPRERQARQAEARADRRSQRCTSRA